VPHTRNRRGGRAETLAVTSRLQFRRALRTQSTDAEARLWYHLRDRRLVGFKFRRQHAFGPFILDFFCQERRLAIELDGGQHFEAPAEAYDRRRTDFLARHGVVVLRFTNDQIFLETAAVLEVITSALSDVPSPHPEREG
jgi:very-short-patch-repair endonuclease